MIERRKLCFKVVCYNTGSVFFLSLSLSLSLFPPIKNFFVQIYNFCKQIHFTVQKFMSLLARSLMLKEKWCFEASQRVKNDTLSLRCTLTFSLGKMSKRCIFNVCHPGAFNRYVNIQWCISQIQQNFMFIFILGQHVSIPIESSSGPSKKQILT